MNQYRIIVIRYCISGIRRVEVHDTPRGPAYRGTLCWWNRVRFSHGVHRTYVSHVSHTYVTLCYIARATYLSREHANLRRKLGVGSSSFEPDTQRYPKPTNAFVHAPCTASFASIMHASWSSSSPMYALECPSEPSTPLPPTPAQALFPSAALGSPGLIS